MSTQDKTCRKLFWIGYKKSRDFTCLPGRYPLTYLRFLHHDQNSSSDTRMLKTFCELISKRKACNRIGGQYFLLNYNVLL